MTINYVCEQFVKGRPIKGAYMSVEQEGDKTVLYWRYSGSNHGKIAEITNRKENGDFDLTICERTDGWGKTSLSNRVWGVLIALQKDYHTRRFTCFVRYHVIVHDRKLDVEYHMTSRPLTLKFRDGQLSVDYRALENHAIPPEERKEVVEPNSNNNIKSNIEKLNNILVTV